MYPNQHDKPERNIHYPNRHDKPERNIHYPNRHDKPERNIHLLSKRLNFQFVILSRSEGSRPPRQGAW